MATLNQCLFIGRLGKDPTSLQVTKEGKTFLRFSLAVDQGKGQEAMWLNVICWDKVAEAVDKYASKGISVFVQGRLQIQKYTDKSTQAERLSVEINATNVQILEKRSKEEVLPDEVLPE
jgi:single-strand DNA-binding protein